jgi:hypothetical protein
MVYNPVSGSLILGDSLVTSTVQTDAPLIVAGAPANGNAVEIISSTATTGNIFNTVASGGGLVLGSSSACKGVLGIVDTAGAGTQFVSVGAGGSGGNLRLQGASTAGYQAPIISNNNAGPATLNIGASANAPQLIFCTDPTGVADQAYVDITKGTANGAALRLQGYGAGSAATVSTNYGSGGGGVLNVTSGYNDANPAIVISNTTTTMNRPMTTFVAPTAGSGTTYTGITRQVINGGGSIGTTAYPLTNPAGAGVYTIMVQVGDNAAVNINGQIDSVGYYNGTTWIAGGVNVSPPLGTGNLILWFGASGTSRNTIYLQNTGSADLSSVVVYMIPQLYGLQAVIV